jgi:hypothetical protein
MALLRRRIRCHYCNLQSRDSVAQMPRQYLCPHCDAANYFDEVNTPRIHIPSLDVPAHPVIARKHYRPPCGNHRYCSLDFLPIHALALPLTRYDRARRVALLQRMSA